jgi:hypothetical protein
VTEFTISASTFEVAWEHSDLGEMPIVIYVQPAGFYEWERAEVVRRAWEELERVGGARDGKHDEELTAMFEVLSTARRAVDARLALGRAGAPGTEFRGMAAAIGDDGVLAKLADRTLTLKTILGSGLSREIVSLLPDHPAGPGRSISLSRDVIDPAAQQAGESLYGFADLLIERGVPGDQARTLVRMIDGTKRRGQFGAAVRDRDGRRTAARRAIAFHDTDNGRYLMTDRVTGDGSVWTTVAPATATMIAEQLQALLDGLARA